MSTRGDTRILVADGDPGVRAGLAASLLDDGFAVLEASTGVEALALLRQQSADVVLADVRLAGLEGIALVRAARQEGLPVLFVMMTSSSSIEAAVDAMRVGAENFLVKPFQPDTLQVVLDKVLEKRRLVREAEQLRDRVRERYRLEAVVGETAALQAVFDVVRRAAPTETAILLLGEPGTGKELVAQAIHQTAPRRDAPFVKVGCAGLSEVMLNSALFGHEGGSAGVVTQREGAFELANRGTVFLDEIGEIPASIQHKLLRLLQQGEFERAGRTTFKVDVRVVAATHRDLAAEVAAGRFREDLFSHLNTVAVTLPALRARKADIPLLVSHFIKKFNQAHGKALLGLLPGVLNDLLRYDWPGNVRELENVIERAVVLSRSEYLTPDELPPAVSRPGSASPCPAGVLAGSTLRDIEREAILRTLQAVEGSTPLAAAMLGISPRKIQYRLKEYASASTNGGPPAPISFRSGSRMNGGRAVG